MTGAIIHLKIKDIHPMVVQTANRNTPSASKLQNIKPQCEDLLWHAVSCYWYCYCQGLRLTLNHCSWMWCFLWPDNSKITEERQIIDRRSLPIINKIWWQCKCHGIKGIIGKDNWQKDRFILSLCFGESIFTPRITVHLQPMPLISLFFFTASSSANLT